MRHRKKGKILGRKKAPRELLLRNLAASVIMYEKVKTTKAKAKAVRPLVEKLITLGKRGDLVARRRLAGILTHENAVRKTLEVLGARYAERKGGYTRITKLGVRQGDAGGTAVISLV